MRRIIAWVVVLGVSLSAAPVSARTNAREAAPATVFDWLAQEHQFLRRYLAVVQQATHDYSYGYRTPTLLMPAAMDLFTGYVAYHHDEEERFLYPVLRTHMTTAQRAALQLVENDQHEESDTVRAWERDLEDYAQGRKTLVEVATTIDYLSRMISRHVVLTEQRVFPLLDTLTPDEQAEVLKQVRAFEQTAWGTTGRSRNEHLMRYIEGQIKVIAGRIW